MPAERSLAAMKFARLDGRWSVLRWATRTAAGEVLHVLHAFFKRMWIGIESAPLGRKMPGPDRSAAPIGKVLAGASD